MMARGSNGKVNLPSKVEWQKVSDLTIGARYQRTLRESKVKDIAENFDPFQFGVPAVVRRADGSMHVTDGQHRISAMRLMGWDDQMIQVEVISGLDYTEEAGMHGDRNANRTATSAFDLFMTNLEAQRPLEVAVWKILEARGLTLAKSGAHPNDGSIYAVGALERIYNTGGAPLLERTLDTIIEAWGPLPDGFQAPILKGVSRLLAEYDRMVDNTRLVKSMKRYRPAEYNKRANAGRELNRSNVVANLVVALVADYNQLPGGKKLPPAEDLLSRPGKLGNRTYTTQAVRAQIRELATQGYSQREVKARFDAVPMTTIKAIFAEVGVKRGRKRKGMR